MEQPLDKQLVVRAIGGERSALDALWCHQRRFVAAVLMAHGARRGELADLLQEVAAKVVAQIHTLRSVEALRPWLRSVARNLAISSGRQRRVRAGQRDLAEVELVDPISQASAEQEPVKERLERTLEIVDGLHPDYREPLLMRCVQGMSQAAISAALELPITTVETRLARARRLLRRELNRQPLGAHPGPGMTDR